MAMELELSVWEKEQIDFKKGNKSESLLGCHELYSNNLSLSFLMNKVAVKHFCLLGWFIFKKKYEHE